MKLSEFYSSQELTASEVELLAYVVRVLRQHHSTATAGRKIQFEEIMDTLRAHAWWLERAAVETGAVTFAPTRAQRLDFCRQAECLDAACNLVLAVDMNFDDIQPILQGHGRRFSNARGAQRR